MDDIKRPQQQLRPDVLTAQPLQAQPAPSQPLQQPQPLDTPAAVIGQTPQEQKQHSSMNHKMNKQTNKPKRKKGPIVAIILAIIVTAGLIGAAAYVYMQSRSKTDAPVATDTSQAAEDQTADGQLEVDDIDATISEIDTQLGTINDSTDFGANDLSDQTLGL